ncbi:hypothetical protein GOC19_32215 [Sinorhizobium meliloti]|uniref:hypothetical protein n=1 Tax=Rhizobium meliloti TaxID=382 RepID=UPI000FD38DFD|nr:hypothetical protein [Sinorhizobium meliloti]MDX0060983.1 hypothetical protein [Sinorhizobium meliloti]RVG48979.1 hypothetical protein CN224_30315 [Sinorhizobium meliloti]RVL75721.1 hypothetical protein CN135_24515 [Sinorhizobium meliloti]
MTAELARYDAMCRAIDEAYQIDEVKDIRDKALALEVYSRQAKNIEAERRACEIRLRAERKAGELRRQEQKAKGFNAASPPPPGGRTPTNDERRKELGISKKQDERWQKLAAVPQEEFEAALAEPGVPTANGIIAKIAEKRSKPMDSAALWLWGRMKDFERNGILADDPDRVWAEMADHMRADMRRLVPRVCEWLNQLEASNAEQGNVGGREAARNSVRRV